MKIVQGEDILSGAWLPAAEALPLLGSARRQLNAYATLIVTHAKEWAGAYGPAEAAEYVAAAEKAAAKVRELAKKLKVQQ